MAGAVEALTSAIGETLAEFSGVRMTRLLANAAAGATSIDVERTDGLPAAGRVLLGGMVYHYGSIDGRTLQGVGSRSGGQAIAGIVAAAAAGDAVFDANQVYSGLDLLRRDIMLDTAEGADLTVIGNNFGIPRDPNFPGDERYRALIQALAYGRRHTVQGLKQALDVLVGPGKYSLDENLIDGPLNITVNIPGGLAASLTDLPPIAQARALGGGYVSGRYSVAPRAGDGGLAVPEGTLRVNSILPPQQDIFTYCTTVLPAVAGPWAYNGAPNTQSLVTGSNGTQATQLQVPTNSSAYYSVPVAMHPDASITASMQFGIVAAASFNNGRQCAIVLNDTARLVSAGVINDGGGYYAVGFLTADGHFLSGGKQFSASAYHTILLKKRSNYVTLYFDGDVVETLSLTSFPATTSRAVQFGVVATTSNPATILVQHLALSVRHRDRDYANQYTSDAQLANNTNVITSQQQTDMRSATQIRVTKSAAVNSYGGNNLGTYYVDQIISDPTSVRVRCANITGKALVGANGDTFGPGRLADNQSVYVAQDNAFYYPNDLGRELDIAGSQVSGTNGTYIIIDLIDMASGKSLIPRQSTDPAYFSTSLPCYTSIAVLRRINGQTASFAPEGGLSVAAMRPRFAGESGVTIEVGGNSYTQGGYAYAPAALPAADVPYAILADTVYSAQLTPDHFPHNGGYQPDGSYLVTSWPLYACDPKSFIARYMSALAGGGVVVNINTI